LDIFPLSSFGTPRDNDSMKFILVLTMFLINLVFNSTCFAETSEEGFFSGRISKINYDISTVRLKVDFDNIKYINPKDKVEFWDEKNDTFKCKGYVLGRSPDYILIKVPEMKFCTRSLYFTTGVYFKFYSEDLVNNITMGKEVVSILLKKRQAILGQMELKNKDLLTHSEKVNTINARYQTLKEKLEEEWKRELHALEEDRTYTMRSFKDLEIRRDEIDKKLELYKVKDENLTLDRWSLDTNLYYKK
jgi:hypothetical protein